MKRGLFYIVEFTVREDSYALKLSENDYILIDSRWSDESFTVKRTAYIYYFVSDKII